MWHALGLFLVPLLLGIALGIWLTRREVSEAKRELVAAAEEFDRAREQLRARSNLGCSISENRVSLWTHSEQERA